MRLPRPVWMLGWVSFFTDTASEMVYPLLPLFLTRVLGAGAMSLGVIEGVAEAANSILKVVSGRLADRWGAGMLTRAISSLCPRQSLRSPRAPTRRIRRPSSERQLGHRRPTDPH